MPVNGARAGWQQSAVEQIYLDNNATTRPCPEAVGAARRAVEEFWGNPSSVHRAGQAARHEVELARAAVADLVGVKPRELVFTGSGTEAIDLVIRGTVRAYRVSAAAGAIGERKGDANAASAADVERRSPEFLPLIITTRVEHAAVRDLVMDLEETRAARVAWAAVDRVGRVDVAHLAELIESEPPALVSVQWANNETGVVQPVGAVAALCTAAGVAFHCDATQWVGKAPTRLDEVPGVMLATFSPHKFHGLKGVGCAVVRRGARLRPMIVGTQELGRRGGTENVPAIMAAGAAARAAEVWLREPSGTMTLAHERDRFEQLVCAADPRAEVIGMHDERGTEVARLWNTSTIAFAGLEAEAILLALSERGVYASAGAACSSGSLEPSPVLLAMGIAADVAHGAIRFSLGRDTTSGEITRAAAIVSDAVRRVRMLA